MIDIRETQLLFTLDNLITYHVLEPSIIHKMLGAYIFFEFDGNVCLRREASAAYFDMIMEEKKGSIKKEEKINLLDYIHKSERDYVKQGLQQFLKDETKEKETFIYRHIIQNGRKLWVKMEVFLIKKGEHSSSLCGIFHDISESVRKTHKLELLDRELYYLNHSVPVGYYRCAIDKLNLPFTYISSSFLKLVEYTREEIEEVFNNKLEEMIHPLDRQEIFQKENSSCLKGKKKLWVKCRIKCRNGYRWFFHQTEFFDMEDCRFFQGAIIDITDNYTNIEEQEQDLKNLQKEAAEVEKKNILKEESKKYLDMIYALSLDYYTIYLVDLETDTFTVQRRTKKLTSSTAERMMRTAVYSKDIEEYIVQYVHIDDREMVQKKLQLESLCSNHMEVAKVYTIRYRRVTEGEIEWIEWRIVKFLGENKKQKALLAIKNVTQEVKKEIEQKLCLENAIKQAESAKKVKKNFLSNMSHDIRTPLNAIVGFSEIAENDFNDKEAVWEYLEKIRASASHLRNLVNNVLEMSQMENGNIELQEEKCNLSLIIRNVISMIQPQFSSKEITLSLDEKIKDKNVYADLVRLQEVFFNILDNMVKFTKKQGSVSIYVRQLESEKEGYGSYEFILEDTGIGMKKEFLEHIFEQFEREKNTTDSKVEGIGLGMAIVKAIIDKMQGKIHVDSEQGKGTKFVIHIMLQLQEQKEGKEKDFLLEEDSKIFYKKRILIVEDNEMNREIARELLEEVGFVIEIAENGLEAVNKIKESKEGYYDAVLMDIQMPVMNGYEATEAIRRLVRKDAAKIPIVALTANAFEEDRKKAIESGMNAHISKPLNVNELCGVLAEYLL